MEVTILQKELQYLINNFNFTYIFQKDLKKLLSTYSYKTLKNLLKKHYLPSKNNLIIFSKNKFFNEYEEYKENYDTIVITLNSINIYILKNKDYCFKYELSELTSLKDLSIVDMQKLKKLLKYNPYVNNLEDSSIITGKIQIEDYLLKVLDIQADKGNLDNYLLTYAPKTYKLLNEMPEVSLYSFIEIATEEFIINSINKGEIFPLLEDGNEFYSILVLKSPLQHKIETEEDLKMIF